MFFTCLEAFTISFIFFGSTYVSNELNATNIGVKTILKGILFECLNKNNQNCEAHLAINIRTDPSLHVSKLNQFLTLDEIYVANRFSTAKLLAPYVIEISRGAPLMMCPLEYDKSVTAEEFENGFEMIYSNRNTKRDNPAKDHFYFEEKSRNSFINGSRRYKYENTDDHEHRNCRSLRKYSLFNTNLPMPFIVTKVKIFQKRHSTWWKLAPSITVDSNSGFYTNGSLSVRLKYHINIFQLSKSINRLHNFKLLIPTLNKAEQLNKIVKPEKALLIYCPQDFLNERAYASNDLSPRHKSINVLKTAQSPHVKATTFLENCPYNGSLLCLNVPDDVVAGYSLKIRLPFVENAFIKPNVFKVKIIHVITDATVKDIVRVSIILVNEGFEAHEFAVNVDCLKRIRSNVSSNSKKLLPHVGETMNFLLPFTFEYGNQAAKKVYCKIQVKALAINDMKRGFKRFEKNVEMHTNSLLNHRIVTTRKITVMPHQRCVCVWKCGCHCLAKLETNVDYNICQELDSVAQSKAGLLTNSNYYELNEKDSEDTNCSIQNLMLACLWFASLFILFMASLGFCKAIIGICLPFVDKWGYDYLQPGRKYADTSKLKHFLINLFYFILLPFLICCNCFTPSAEDLFISNSDNFMTKIYIYVYEVFYDNAPTVVIIEEAATSLQTDEN